MTAPRVPLFQRKGPPAGPPRKPAITIAIGHSQGPGDTGGPADDGAGETDIHDVTCPVCGAEFDATTDKVIHHGSAGKPDGAGAPPPGADALANLFGGSAGSPSAGG